MKTRPSFFIAPHLAWALAAGFILALAFSMNAHAKCKILGKVNAPQNLRCGVSGAGEEKTISIKCGYDQDVNNEIYSVKVDDSEKEIVNNTYYVPVKKDNGPVVFEANSGTFKIDAKNLSAEYHADGKTYTGSCQRGSY